MRQREIDVPRRGTLRILEGEGPQNAPVLMLLHGLAATAALNWGTSVPSLERGFRVVAPDHRGHGGGLAPWGRFRLEQCADDVAVLADALGIERFIAVGYSMGGPIAQLTWKRHPERVSGIVLCATAARFASAEQRRTANALRPVLSLAARSAPASFWRGQAEQMLERIADPARREVIAREIEGTRPAAVVDAAAALARYDARPWLGDVSAPTAVVATTQDGHVPLPRQLEMAEAIPGARVHRIDTDHYACVGRPDLFIPALETACRDVAMASPVRATG